MKRWIYLGFALIFIFSLTHSSCGKKPAPEVSASSQVTESTVLPELAQNKMYLTNHPVVSGPQDTTFQPVPDEMQPKPADDGLETQSANYD